MGFYNLGELAFTMSFYETFNNFKTTKNESFLHAYKRTTKFNYDDSDYIVCYEDMVISISKTIVRELFVLLKDAFAKNSVNYDSPDIKNYVKRLKTKFPPELKSVDSQEILKSIRDMIAHNSYNEENFSQYSFDQYHLVFHKKGVTEPILVDMTFNEVFEMLQIFDKNKDPKCFGHFDLRDDIKSTNQLMQARKKTNKYEGLLTYYDMDNKKIDIDKYQEKAFFRFLIKNKSFINVFEAKYGCPFFHLMRYFPCKSNNFHHSDYKYYLLRMLADYLQDKTITFDKLEKGMKEKFTNGILPLYDDEFFKSLIYSSMMFNICASFTNEELEQIFSAFSSRSSEEIRHIRNGMIHGRYFYNYDNGFEIYDGIGDLEHFATLSNDEIFKAVHVVNKMLQIESVNIKNKNKTM